MLMPPTHIHTAEKVVVTPDDLKGLKLHCAEAQVAVSAQAAGATAVEMDIGDMPMSLDRGLIDGVVNHFPVLYVFGALEYLEQHTVFGDGGINMTPMFVIMNRDKFHSLPADLQKVIIDSRPIWHDFFLEADLGFQGFVKGQAAEMGHTFTELTPEQITEWYNLVKGPVHEEWLADYDDQGLPATAVYEEALRLIGEY
jgi:TRAP-type C4-dicarboxylate transport system substrate-binding protein